jgi:YD repeat-containing protein
VRSAVAAVLLAGLAAGPQLLAAEPCLRGEDFDVVELDTISDRCGYEARIAFTLCRPARVSFPYARSVTLASGPVPEGGAVELGAGRHEAWIVGSGFGDRLRLEVGATYTGRPNESLGEWRERQPANRNFEVVGRSYVHGVDLFDGHFTLRSRDLDVPGRHLGLAVERTFSSAGSGVGSALGPGWRLNWNWSLVAPPGCRSVAVTTGDGSSQVFRALEGGSGFQPQFGRHTRLERTADGYVFQDKAGNRALFRPVPGSSWRHRLASIVERHGDRVSLHYDDLGRLVEVREDLNLGGRAWLTARTLMLTWTRTGGGPRLERASVPGLGLSVDYEYDARGRLVRATARDEEEPRPRVETFEYATGARLARAVLWNGQKHEYHFRKKALATAPKRPLLGGDFRSVLEKISIASYAQRKGAETRFDFRVRAGAEETVVTDGDGATTYRFDSHGRTLEEQAPDGTRLRKIWAEDDVLQTAEIGFDGAEVRWEYDALGNRTREERRAGPGQPAAVTTWRWDPAFSVLLEEVDARGRTHHEIDPRTGDRLATTTPDGRTVRSQFDAHGQLVGHDAGDGTWTRFTHHDTFGNPQRVVAPDGTVTWRAFDLRGREFAPPAASAKK